MNKDRIQGSVEQAKGKVKEAAGKVTGDALDRGGSRNFAGTFAFWDVLFGTYYMPEHQLPDAYGIDDASFPEGFGSQMLYPFRQ